MSKLQRIFAAAAIGAVALAAPQLSRAQQPGDSPDTRQPPWFVDFGMDMSGCTSDGYTQSVVLTLEFRAKDIADLSPGDVNSDAEVLLTRLRQATDLQDHLQSDWRNVTRQFSHVEMHADRSGQSVDERQAPSMAEFDAVENAIGVRPAGLGWNWRAPAVQGCEP
jgi:hypothetical protein